MMTNISGLRVQVPAGDYECEQYTETGFFNLTVCVSRTSRVG